MQSINQSVNALHASYCEATSFDLALLPVFERNWFAAVALGIQPDDIKLVIKERIRGINKQERRGASIFLRNVIGSEESLAEVIQELAAIKARMRIKVLPEGKQEVFRATGRSDRAEPTPARIVADVDLIKKLREAAG